MFKKFISVCLTAMIFTVASGINIYAQTGEMSENQTVARQETKPAGGDLKSLVKAQSDSDGVKISNKSTLADYEKSQKQGKKFSTTTKVLIGVGIAAVVVGVVIFAASRDKIRTF